MKKPLLVTNDDWAKGSCEKAAYYLDTDDLSKVASQIEYLINNTSTEQKIIEEGIKQLNTYPTPKEKISQFVNIINKYTKE